MTWGAPAVVAQSVFRLQKPGPVWNADTSTVFGSTPTRGNLTSRSPAPALWMVLTAPAELKFTAGGAGAYGPASSGWLSKVYANSLGWFPITALARWYVRFHPVLSGVVPLLKQRTWKTWRAADEAHACTSHLAATAGLTAVTWTLPAGPGVPSPGMVTVQTPAAPGVTVFTAPTELNWVTIPLAGPK